MIIGCDIDGVIYPWSRAVRRLWRDKYGDIGESTHWDYVKERISEADWAWMWSDALVAPLAMFGQLDMEYEDGVKAVRKLLTAGHDLHFVTHRNPERSGAITCDWLDSRFTGYKSVHVLDNAIDKSQLALGLGCQLFIDDKPEVCDDVLRNTRADVFMPTRPWNESWTPDIRDAHRFHRFENWEEVLTWASPQMTTITR